VTVREEIQARYADMQPALNNVAFIGSIYRIPDGEYAKLLEAEETKD
jgi:hypothetical protein